jgi:hypothetical protein
MSKSRHRMRTFKKGFSSGFCSFVGEKPPAHQDDCYLQEYRAGVKAIDDAADNAFQNEYSLYS